MYAKLPIYKWHVLFIIGGLFVRGAFVIDLLTAYFCVKFKLYHPPLVKLLGFVLLQSYHGELSLSFYLPCLSNCIQILVEFTFNNYIIFWSGDRSRLKDDVVPSVFYFENKEQTPIIPRNHQGLKGLNRDQLMTRHNFSMILTFSMKL